MCAISCSLTPKPVRLSAITAGRATRGLQLDARADLGCTAIDELQAHRCGAVSRHGAKGGGIFYCAYSADGRIPVDFCQPAEPKYYDDITAAAVAACGL